MRPIEFISAQSVAPAKNTDSPNSINEAVWSSQFLTVSAQYLNLPADRLALLKQRK